MAAAIMHARSARLSILSFFWAVVLLEPAALAQLSTSTIPSSSSASTTSDPSSTITSASNTPSSTAAPSSTSNNPSSTRSITFNFTPTSSPTGDDNGNSYGGLGGDPSKYYPIIGVVVAVVLSFIAFRVLKKRRKQLEDERLRRVVPYVPAGRSSRRPYMYRRSGRERNGSTLSMPEGVDERGEAPPPYHAGSKPPSINAGVTEHYSTEDVEMGRMDRPSGGVPGHDDSGDIGDMRRPPPAVTTAPRNETTTT